MKIMKRILIIAILFSIAVTGFTAGQQEDKVRIGFSIGDISNQTWVEMYKLMQKRADELGAEIILNDAKMDPNSQISSIENFIASDMDAIIVHAFDKEASVPAINKAMEAGLKVIAYDVKIDNYDSSLTADNYNFGYAVGEAAANWINEEMDGKAVVGFVNYPLLPILVERVQGMTAALKKLAPNATIAQEVAASDASSTIQAVEDLMQAHPDVNVICTTAGLFASSANESINAQNMGSDKFGIFCCDATEDVLRIIKEDGLIRTAVAVDILVKGPQMVDTAVKLVNGESVPKDIYFEMIPVTSENIEEYSNM